MVEFVLLLAAFRFKPAFKLPVPLSALLLPLREPLPLALELALPFPVKLKPVSPVVVDDDEPPLPLLATRLRALPLPVTPRFKPVPKLPVALDAVLLPVPVLLPELREWLLPLRFRPNAAEPLPLDVVLDEPLPIPVARRLVELPVSEVLALPVSELRLFEFELSELPLCRLLEWLPKLEVPPRFKPEVSEPWLVLCMPEPLLTVPRLLPELLLRELPLPDKLLLSEPVSEAAPWPLLCALDEPFCKSPNGCFANRSTHLLLSSLPYRWRSHAMSAYYL